MIKICVYICHICVLFHVKQKTVRRDKNVSRETFTVTNKIVSRETKICCVLSGVCIQGG